MGDRVKRGDVGRRSSPLMVGSVSCDVQHSYMPIPLAGLVGADPVPFPLHLRTADDTWVLYRPAASMLDESHIGRLTAEGVASLFIEDADRDAYFHRVESSLGQLMLDRTMPLEDRANVLFGVAATVAEDLLNAQPDGETVMRARRVMSSTSRLFLREGQGFHAVRRLLSGGDGLVRHSLTVSFLSMGLARLMLGSDAETMTLAGMAGLLHDVGKIGHEDLEHDPEHTTRGAEYLRGLNLPLPVLEAAESHHECSDGTGFPKRLQGADIPVMARIVGLVNLFDKVYSNQEPRVGVFDALRILAQAYRGSFDERMAQGLVKLFR